MLFILFISFIVIYFYGIRKLRLLLKNTPTQVKRSEIKFSLWLIAIYAAAALFIVTILGNFFSDQLIKYYILSFSNIHFSSDIVYDSVKESLKMLPQILKRYPGLQGANKISFYIENKDLLLLYKQYNLLALIIKLATAAVALILGIVLLNKLFAKLKNKLNAQTRFESVTKKFLLISSLITIAATLAIIVSLLWETILFFEQVPLFSFLFGTSWLPQNAAAEPAHSFGILPLLSGTFLIAIIACAVALIIALPAAIYMAEYMPKNIKTFVKPILEILSGIPTIVYGFFAALVLGPNLVKFASYFNISTSNESAIVAGLVIGIMIVPFISSATDDIISSIPKATREAGYALGSMSYEVVLKILLPISMPGILASFLLAFSRAIGETMIVVMASGLVANLTFNPFAAVTTITTQIVTIAQGDQDFGSIKTLSLFALGLTLFCITLLLNLFSFWVMRRFQRKY